MVNAAPENETNNEAELVGEEPAPAPAAAEEVERVRLPLQLQRLPADKLLKVHQAIMELQEAGLSEVPDLSHLSKVMKQSTPNNSRIPDDGFTSEYMAMTLWSWTPKRWFENIQAQGKAAGGENEDTQEVELPALEMEVLEKNLEKRIQRFEKGNEQKREKRLFAEVVDVEKVRAWFQKMKENDAEIRAFPELNAKQSGDGVGVLFEKLPSAGGPRVLPKVNTAGTLETGPKMGEGGTAKAGAIPSVIHMHLGPESCTAAQTIWRRYLDDHMLDGSARPKGEFYGCSQTLFAESRTGRYIPRAVLASYDQGTMDLLGEAGLFNPSGLLASSSPGDSFDSGNSHGSFKEEIMECIRHQMEEADHVEGFLIAHTAGEDLCTNGLISSLLPQLSVDYGKKCKFTFTGMPECGEVDARHGTAGYLFGDLIEHADLTSFYDRASLTKIAAGKVNGLGISSPDDLTLNGLVARVIGSVTGPMRFGKLISASEGFRYSSLQHLATNLTSYPRIHFVTSSLGGLTAKGMEDFAVVKPNQDLGAGACTHAMKKGSLCSVDYSQGKLIAQSMLCRGVELSSAVSKAAEFKTDRAYQYVDWSPTGFSIFCYKDPKVSAPEVTVLRNTTAVSMYAQSAQNGLENTNEESGFRSECIENLAALCKDYEEVGCETADEEYGEEDYGDEF